MKSWAGKGLFAILDQIFISGSNFMVSVLLARWSSPSQYGAFALAFSIFLLLSQIHQSLVLEPMSVYGGSYSANALKRYFGSLLHLQNAMAVAIVIPLALAAVALQHWMNNQELGAALWGVTIASPFILLFWVARRALYLENAPGPAAAGAVVYSAVTLAGLLLVRSHQGMTPFAAFVVMAGAAFATSSAMLFHLRPEFRSTGSLPRLGRHWNQHWQYGSWALAGALAMWVPQNIYYAVNTGINGMSGAADIRALVNLALPLQRTITALGMLFLPYMARVTCEHGFSGARSLTRKIAWLFGLGAIGYWLVILLFQNQILHMMYGGKYSGLRGIIPWLACSSTLNSIIAAYAIGLRAMRSPASVFYAYAASTVVTFVVGIPATWLWGVSGVIFGFIVSNIAILMTILVLMKRRAGAVSGDEVASSHHAMSGSVVAILDAIPDAKPS